MTKWKWKLGPATVAPAILDPFAPKPVLPSPLDEVTATLAAMDAARVRPPPVLVDRLMAEALALVAVAERYQRKLKEAGLDRSAISTLELRTRALGEAHLRLELARATTRPSSELDIERDARIARADLIAAARFALRDDTEAMAALFALQEGEDARTLIPDLRALAKLLGRHLAAFDRIGFKARKRVVEAETMAADLEAVREYERELHPDEVAARETRDRATILLLESMTLVRAAGEYAFRAKPRILVRFRTAYDRTRVRL
ncbi:MAG: hypothetical protein JWM74_660 [Myxococcaceae bacterium]|nr:hypothetical protein [Myxococcaceae bacterium]